MTIEIPDFVFKASSVRFHVRFQGPASRIINLLNKSDRRNNKDIRRTLLDLKGNFIPGLIHTNRQFIEMNGLTWEIRR